MRTFPDSTFTPLVLACIFGALGLTGALSRWLAVLFLVLADAVGIYGILSAGGHPSGARIVFSVLLTVGIGLLGWWSLSRGANAPLAAQLRIQERCISPSPDRLKPGIEHIFFLADIELSAPRTAKVSYSLDLIRHGMRYTAEWVQDVEEWQVFDKEGNRGPAVSLAVHLVRGGKVDGWLHFRVDSIGETELRGCTLRLWAKTKRDSIHCEYQGNAWPMPRRDLTIKKSRALDQEAHAFHDLLEKAATVQVAPKVSVPERKDKPASSSSRPAKRTSDA